MLENIKKAAKYILNQTDIRSTKAIVIGSGIGDMVHFFEVLLKIPYSSIPFMPESTVKGHEGVLILTKIGSEYVWIFKGRFHYYEGYSMEKVTFPIRVLKYLGIEELGPRFVDMHEAYSKNLQQALKQSTKNKNIFVQEGIYLVLSGSTFETPAEYNMVKSMGADTVGISPVPECIVAKHMGLSLMGISVIADLGDTDFTQEINHEEVLEISKKSSESIAKIVLDLWA